MLLSKDKKQRDEDQVEATTMPEEKKRKFEETLEEETCASADSLSSKKKLKASDQSETANPNQTPMEVSNTISTHCEDSKVKSPENGCEIIEPEDILCESNSINDASDAISDDDDQIVQQKPAKKKFQRETIIDDDLIIEEDSNDFKAEEELDLKRHQAEVNVIKFRKSNRRLFLIIFNHLDCYESASQSGHLKLKPG